MPLLGMNEYDGDYCINPGEDIHLDKRFQGESNGKRQIFKQFQIKTNLKPMINVYQI